MDAAAKTQIVERIKQANNILVTVSTNPSVDQLAACIGLTLLLNKMQKQATAVFSGHVPSTLEFLQPEKTIETNTDSLRDFIISLDKEKADKLRYKVEDQVVRIFITPYRTSLSEKDLVFSEGDFNVEVVIALGIKDRTQMDASITAHGRILHDATVISLNAGNGAAPELGQINWQDTAASSLSEMVVSISEAFGGGLIDNQMATAFLTGIVAETDRFANKKTTPRVMTISAQLMASGANQQLIVSKLVPEVQTPVIKHQPAVKTHRPAVKTAAPPTVTPPAAPEASLEDGAIKIDHEIKNKTEPQARLQIGPDEIHIDKKGNLTTAASMAMLANEEPQPSEPEVPPSPKPPAQPPKLPPATPPPPTSPPPPPPPTSPPPVTAKIMSEPSAPSGPHAFLNPLSTPPIINSTFTANSEPEWADAYNSVAIDPLSGGTAQPGFLEHKNNLTPSPDNARDAVEKAYEAAPFDPAMAPPVQSLGAQPVDLNTTDTSQSGQPSDQPALATAPPFPPPLTPTQGVVIPNTSNPTA